MNNRRIFISESCLAYIYIYMLFFCCSCSDINLFKQVLNYFIPYDIQTNQFQDLRELG